MLARRSLVLPLTPKRLTVSAFLQLTLYDTQKRLLPCLDFHTSESTTMNSLEKFFKSPASAARDDNSEALSLECLEERQMLSTVSVFAQGSTGQESFELYVRGSLVGTINNVPTEVTEFQFDVDDNFLARDVRVEFVNDLFDPANGIDRNLTVDKIQIDNLIFETEDRAVFADGVYTPEDGITFGFGLGETLNSNGSFSYRDDGFSAFADAAGNEVTIDATGFGDELRFELQVDGETVQNFEIFNNRVDRAAPAGGESSGIFSFQLREQVSADRIQVAFTSDRLIDDPFFGGTIDRNLQINSVTIDGEVYRGTDSDVFSTGTFADGGIEDGFGRGNTLHTNGFFQFADRDSGPAQDTVVRIDAAGFGDSIDFELQIDGQTFRTFALSPRAGTSARVFTVTLDETVSADRIRVAFTNDLQFVDPISGSTIDRNLLINSVTIDGEVFRGTDSDVFSTGTWTASDGVQDGFGRGNFLHANGYFQFA